MQIEYKPFKFLSWEEFKNEGEWSSYCSFIEFSISIFKYTKGEYITARVLARGDRSWFVKRLKKTEENYKELCEYIHTEQLKLAIALCGVSEDV